jgi:hypothetical protein
MVAKMLHRMFSYLDRYYLKDANKKKTGPVAIEMFFNAMTQSAKETIRHAIQQEFTKDRNGNVVDKDLMKRVVQTYH